MKAVRFVVPTLVAALALGVTLKRLGETHVDDGIVTAVVAQTPYTDASERIARPTEAVEPPPSF
jgi:hypothetical protein